MENMVNVTPLGRSFFGHTGWGFSKFAINCNLFKIVQITFLFHFQCQNVKFTPIKSDNELSSDFYASPVICPIRSTGQSSKVKSFNLVIWCDMTVKATDRCATGQARSLFFI